MAANADFYRDLLELFLFHQFYTKLLAALVFFLLNHFPPGAVDRGWSTSAKIGDPFVDAAKW